MSRVGWDEYFSKISRVVSERGTCPRLKVGCVIVKENEIVATGYNGSPRGEEHCEDEGCLMSNGGCVRTIHAEMNAIMQCVKNGISLDGATIYVTHFPCYNCAKHIVQAGIKRVCYINDYRSMENSYNLFKRRKMGIVKL